MTRALLTLAAVAVFAQLRNPAAAGEVETRTFQVKVDGKPAGDYRMVIREEDGVTTVTGQASVSVRYFVYRYSYSYQGTEAWKDGRLQRLESQTNDDGKRYQVTAVAEGDQLHVWSNGNDHRTRADSWTTTYWRLADPKLRNQPVILLDADTGKDIRATLRFVGTQQLSVGGQVQECTHYRLAGGVSVELWYDAQERLVKQEAIEDGHRTALELTRINR